MDCLYFLQVKGEIWIPVDLYEDEAEVRRAVIACRWEFGLPVRRVSSSRLSECLSCLGEVCHAGADAVSAC